MTSYPLVQLSGRFWRMARVPHQFDALSGEGARLFGGRWNRRGEPALYLAQDHATAIAEYHQAYVFPGTLIPVEVSARSIADLTDGQGGPADARVRSAIEAEWLYIARIEGSTPPSWSMAERLIRDGAEGALVPSVQNRGGTNLVLWRWGEGGGAKVRLIDPEGDLG